MCLKHNGNYSMINCFLRAIINILFTFDLPYSEVPFQDYIVLRSWPRLLDCKHLFRIAESNLYNNLCQKPSQAYFLSHSIY